MSIPRGVTPTFELILEGVDLTEAGNVYVTFAFLGGTLTKSGDEIEISAETEEGNPVSTISVYLSQEETLRFQEETVKIQVNWVYSDGSRAASEIAGYDFSKQLLAEVIE